MNQITKHGLINSLLTALYIGLVASFMFYGQNIIPPKDNVLMPMVMLLLFVFSAGLTSFLVFGRPIMWYMDGKKKEALLLLATTLGFMFIITITTLLTLILCFSR